MNNLCIYLTRTITHIKKCVQDEPKYIPGTPACYTHKLTIVKFFRSILNNPGGTTFAAARVLPEVALCV